MTNKIAKCCVDNDLFQNDLNGFISDQEQLYRMIKTKNNINEFIKNNKCVIDIKCLELACEVNDYLLIEYICRKYDIKPTKKCFEKYIKQFGEESVLVWLINKMFDEN